MQQIYKWNKKNMCTCCLEFNNDMPAVHSERIHSVFRVDSKGNYPGEVKYIIMIFPTVFLRFNYMKNF